MRYAIFADVHANLEALEAVLTFLDGQDINRYICVGDIVGYGADPNLCVERVRQTCDVIVAGNHDWGGVGLLSVDFFNPDAKEAILWTTNQLSVENHQFLSGLELVYEEADISVVHSTLNAYDEFPYLCDTSDAQQTFSVQRTRLCFVGHTHIPAVFAQDKNKRVFALPASKAYLDDNNFYIINVGSVGQPRDWDNRAACCIYDTQKNEITFHRLAYDIDATAGKIRSAGLPEFLARRLFVGG